MRPLALRTRVECQRIHGAERLVLSRRHRDTLFAVASDGAERSRREALDKVTPLQDVEDELSVTVRNSGTRPGDEIVQLYCRDDVASVARPDRLLLGFARVSLEPGRARRLTFSVHPSRLAFFDPQMRFVAEPGAFTFSVGASGADIRAVQTLVLDGEAALYAQREIVATRVTIA